MKHLILFAVFCCISRVATLSYAAELPPLKVVTEDFSPFQIVEHHKLVGGAAYTIVKAMLKKAGVQAEIEVMPWARAYVTAKKRANTIIFSMARNDNREPYFHWFYKIKPLKYSFYALKSRHDLQPKSLNDVLSYNVVSVRKSYESNSLKRLGFKEGQNLSLAVRYEEAWKMLYYGRVDFFYANGYYGDILKKSLSENGSDFEPKFSVGEMSDLYIAANLKTDQKLIKRFKNVLKEMEQDGTIAKIKSKWPI